MYSNLTLVIPAKNESESLPAVLRELKKFKIKKNIILEKKDKKTIKSIKKFDCKIIMQKKPTTNYRFKVTKFSKIEIFNRNTVTKNTTCVIYLEWSMYFPNKIMR